MRSWDRDIYSCAWYGDREKDVTLQSRVHARVMKLLVEEDSTMHAHVLHEPDAVQAFASSSPSHSAISICTRLVLNPIPFR